jgi:hypothetical protein
LVASTPFFAASTPALHCKRASRGNFGATSCQLCGSFAAKALPQACQVPHQARQAPLQAHQAPLQAGQPHCKQASLATSRPALPQARPAALVLSSFRAVSSPLALSSFRAVSSLLWVKRFFLLPASEQLSPPRKGFWAEAVSKWFLAKHTQRQHGNIDTPQENKPTQKSEAGAAFHLLRGGGTMGQTVHHAVVVHETMS